jgi:hypothetical protein
MSITGVDKDLDSLTLTLVADVDARRLWADPRQLDRWRGPPTQSGDFTTGPDGDTLAVGGGSPR